MQSLRHLQFAQIKQTTKNASVALTFMLVLLGCVFSLSAFTLAPSALAQSSYSSPVRQIHKHPAAGCFPNNAVWTWVSADKIFQAWIGPYEVSPDKHFNFHVSPICSNDSANYHISYSGNGIWKSSNSVDGKTAYYGHSGYYICDSLSVAASDQAGAAGGHVYNIDKDDLINKSLLPLYRSMDLFIGGIC